MAYKGDPYKVWDYYYEYNPEKVLERSPYGVVIEGYDHYNTVIKREARRQEGSDFGWDVDHIVRERDGGGNKLNNLRPMHIANNRRRN